MVQSNFVVSHENSSRTSKELGKFANSCSTASSFIIWVLDIGAIGHMIVCLDLLINVKFDRKFTNKTTNGSIFHVEDQRKNHDT